MESIASKLRTRRESLNISLEQISNDTRISIHHLRSLENGLYDDLPGGMYNRAILRTYCDELGLDKNEILQRYDTEVVSRQEKPVIRSSAISASKIKTHTAVAWSVVFLIAVGFFLNREWFISAVYPYFSSGSSTNDRPPTPPLVDEKIMNMETVDAQAAENVAIDGLTANVKMKTDSGNSIAGRDIAVEASPRKAVQTPPRDDSTASQPLLRIEIVVTEECWLSIDRDESGAVTKILSPGQVEFINAARTVSLTVGNAGGVSLRINDRAAKTLGRQGQVVHLVIDKDTLKNFFDPFVS
jgi:cytoskeletal protein RodZ